MQETSSASQTFFLPILILIVVQLAKIAQDVDVIQTVSDEHPPLLISPVAGIVFSVIRWIVVGVASAIVLKLLSDKLEARIQAWYYERLQPALEPVHKTQIRLIERILGKDINDDAAIIQFILQLRSVSPKLLPSPLFLMLPSEPNPRVPHDQIESIGEYRVKTIDYIYALESRLIPDLGRFMFIHSANSVLLLLGMLFSSILLSGSFRKISILITLLVWAILPVFELDEYDVMLSENVAVYSLPVHILNVLILTLAVVGIGENFHILLPFVDIPLRIQYSGWFAYSITGFLLILTVWLFASILENELKRVTTEISNG